MRKHLTYAVKPEYRCTCGESYESAPEKCTNVIGTEHVISHVENRDEGKEYVIREMPCRQATRWAVKLFAALLNAGMKVPEGMALSGMAGASLIGFDSMSNLKAEDAQALLDELLGCVQIVRDRRHPEKSFEMVSDDDVEEVATYFKLAREAFMLHVGFSNTAVQ